MSLLVAGRDTVSFNLYLYRELFILTVDLKDCKHSNFHGLYARGTSENITTLTGGNPSKGGSSTEAHV